MITDDGKRQLYLAVKILPALLKGITYGESSWRVLLFKLFLLFHSYTTRNKLKKPERVCNDHDYCCVDMPKEHKMKYLPGEKSLIVPFIIYGDLQCLLEKMRSCKTTLKILTQRKMLSTNFQDTHVVQYARLMIQKTDAIFTGEMIVLKSFVKI